MGLKRSARLLGQEIRLGVLDAWDSLLSRRPPLVPPRRLDYNRDFTIGDRMVALLQDYAGLRPDSRVMDLGCGVARVGASLTKVLGPAGSYVGIDIVRKSIAWLQAEYRDRHPNFSFHHLDLHNSAYNPLGKLATEDVDFAFLGQQKFDVIFLFSVFTHLYPQHVRHYLKAFRTVLKPDGVVFTSVFVNDDFAKEQQRLSEETGRKLTHRKFRHVGDGFYAPKSGNPELAVAFDPDQIADMWGAAGYDFEIKYGSWCGRPGGHWFYQDVIVARPRH